MESLSPHGYSAVLRNRNFLALWMAQVLSNTALNGSFFLQLILIEEITGSSAQLAAVILAFVHLYTMFMVVPLFNSMMRIDRALIEAARDAGIEVIHYSCDEPARDCFFGGDRSAGQQQA